MDLRKLTPQTICSVLEKKIGMGTTYYMFAAVARSTAA